MLAKYTATGAAKHIHKVKLPAQARKPREASYSQSTALYTPARAMQKRFLREMPRRSFASSGFNNDDGEHFYHNPKAVPDNVRQRFEEAKNELIIPRLEKQRRLFTYLDEVSSEQGLNPTQFEFYRGVMYRRVHPTILSILEQLKWAFERGDYNTASTAMLNLKEEAAEGVASSMHPVLMEKAYNAIGEDIFGLKSQTMIAATKDPILVEEGAYLAMVTQLYKETPIVASWIQEFSSGGDNTPANPGMMGDMYKLFFNYRDKMPVIRFKDYVVPYFKAHIALDPVTQRQVFGKKAVEHDHAVRAEEDLLRHLKTPQDVDRAMLKTQAFLDAQMKLFDATKDRLQALEKEGRPIKAKVTFKQRIEAEREKKKDKGSRL